LWTFHCNVPAHGSLRVFAKKEKFVCKRVSQQRITTLGLPVLSGSPNVVLKARKARHSWLAAQLERMDLLWMLGYSACSFQSP
jgi:hypothetical protein